jgi:cell wall-associated NlpC family hydrolase
MSDARDEALRLAKEAGLSCNDYGQIYATGSGAVLIEDIASLIALARASAAPAVAQEADKGPWTVYVDGGCLQSEDFTHDARLYINGDFSDDAQRMAYAKALAAQLNAAPQPQEPVAWMVVAPWGNSVSFEKPDFGRAEWKAPAQQTIALYADPQPQAPSSDDVRDKRIAEAPRPPDITPLPLVRYGRTGAGDSILFRPMADGYWTPWHVAQAHLDAALADARDKALEEAAQMFEKRCPQWDDCANAIRALRTHPDYSNPNVDAFAVMKDLRAASEK